MIFTPVPVLSVRLTIFRRICFVLTFDADGLALKGNAFPIFGRVSRHGLPYMSVAVSAAFGLLAYMAVSSGAGRVFGWCVSPDNSFLVPLHSDFSITGSPT